MCEPLKILSFKHLQSLRSHDIIGHMAIELAVCGFL